ncbi:hypothetical protein JCM10212_000904 [Sporobolomyces blumeae]
MFSSGTSTPTATRSSRRAGGRASRAAGLTVGSAAPPSTLGAPSTSASAAPSAFGASQYGSRSHRTYGSTARGGQRATRAMDEVDNETLDGTMQVDATDPVALARHEAESRHERVLVKDETYVVTERKRLPVEVQQAISFAAHAKTESDPYTQPVKAVLDAATGFALLVTSEYCFVWNWTKSSPSATTYVFPLPPSTPLSSTVQAFAPLSFASLVPSSSSSISTAHREPGLLVVSTLGQVQYWDSVSMSLSGVERYKSTTLALDSSATSSAGIELVRSLVALSPTAYLVSTSHARMFVVTIASVAGRTEINSRALEKSSGGWASSILSSVFGSGGGGGGHGRPVNPRAGILALAVSPSSVAGQGQTVSGGGAGGVPGEKQVFAVMEKTCHVWNVSSTGSGERLVGSDVDLFAAILEAIEGRKVGNEQWAMNEGKVEIVDAKVTTTGSLAVLVSHVVPNTAEGFQSFAIVMLNVVGSMVEVAGITRLNYQARPDPRPLSTPQLSLAAGGIAFVVFADAVVLVSLAIDSPFEENFALRHNTNRFIGVSESVGAIAPRATPAGPSATLSLLTSTSSLLTLNVTPPASPLPLSITNTSETYKTRKLKAKVEHAIYFGIGSAAGASTRQSRKGEDEENLFKFDLQRDYEGDLAVAVEGVSKDLLASASPNMPVILDLRAQLADRAFRAKALIEYINDNGLVGKLPQSTRRRLSWDAERIVAAGALWGHFNARLGEQTVLSDAILSFIDNVGEGFGEDPLRLFFRSKLGSLGDVLEEVSKHAQASVSSSAQSSEAKAKVLHEANQVFILVFNAIARHRLESLKLYAIDPASLGTEPWSSRVPILKALEQHFEATHSLLSERVRDFGANEGRNGARGDAAGSNGLAREQDEFKSQMASLAEYTFSALEERLLFLRTSHDDGSASPEARTLNERYLTLRPKFLKTLVSIGKVSSAYELAERHRDFRSLVELSTDLKHGSDFKVRSFLDKYQKEFAFPLYEYYLENGQHRTLLEPDEAHRPLLTAYLDSTSNARLAWINDIAISRYDHATSALVSEASQEASLTQQKILFSLSKLAQIAQVTKETIETEPVQRAIEAVDDNLDLVNSQQGVRAYFFSLLSHADSQLPNEAQGRAVAERVASSLADRPAFAKHFASLSARLLQDQSVTAEELIDVLTLKVNEHEQAGDFASALDVLVRVKDLPQARKQLALENTWRRVYIQDDWSTLRNSAGLRDEEMASALRSTAFYATLASASGSNHPPSMYLEPLQSRSSATIPLLSALHPSLSSQEVELLLVDYEVENARLARLVQQDGLDEFAKEVVRLVRADEEGAGDGMGDVGMNE